MDWYQPLHKQPEPVLIPEKARADRDFPLGKETKADTDFWKDINGAVLARSLQGQIVMGNVDSTEASFTRGGEGAPGTPLLAEEHVRGLREPQHAVMGIDDIKTLSWNLNGDTTLIREPIRPPRPTEQARRSYRLLAGVREIRQSFGNDTVRTAVHR